MAKVKTILFTNVIEIVGFGVDHGRMREHHLQSLVANLITESAEVGTQPKGGAVYTLDQPDDVSGISRDTSVVLQEQRHVLGLAVVGQLPVGGNSHAQVEPTHIRRPENHAAGMPGVHPHAGAAQIFCYIYPGFDLLKVFGTPLGVLQRDIAHINGHIQHGHPGLLYGSLHIGQVLRFLAQDMHLTEFDVADAIVLLDDPGELGNRDGFLGRLHLSN